MSTAARPCRVSIVIKALNEERNIGPAIESCLAALRNIEGEVVLADSHSTDGTVREASRYPVRVVRLADPGQRSCGTGPQLGYQHAEGEYIYILDGDMKLVPGFLEQALSFLAQHPEIAGVGGRVVELNLESLEYRERGERSLKLEAHRLPGQVDRLDGGGLYRRRAIEEAGWLSDRNLHSYEEFDLATRLRARGWKLWRLPFDAATHYGHDAPPYQLLARRWRSRYACGPGELVRAALGRPHWRLVVRGLRELRLYTAVVGWWVLLGALLVAPLALAAKAIAFIAIAAAPLVAMAWRKRSWTRALYSVVSWNVNSAGMVRGLFAPRIAPHERIASDVLHEPLDAPTMELKERNTAHDDTA